jgi:hypothetical protein
MIGKEQTLTLWIHRFVLVCRDGLPDFVDMALDRRERDCPGFVGADIAGPGYAGRLEIVGQVVGRSERTWPGLVVFDTGLVECAEFLDSVDLQVG